MASLKPNRQLLVLAIAAFTLLITIGNFLRLSESNIKSQIHSIPVPAIPGLKKKPWHYGENLDDSPEPVDEHPISLLMRQADKTWRTYEDSRSTTFRQTVSRYRRRYGRHPPPGFKDWYQYARKKDVHNIDDFEQIMDDMRPFWAVEPRVLRNLAANMWKDESQGVAGIHIRNHKVAKVTHGSWRSETMVTLIEKFIKYLPDMDIAMNRLDQPRVVVPWGDMQDLLEKELKTRKTPPETSDAFTMEMQELLNMTADDDGTPKEDPEWYAAHGKQYMDIASTACPPEAHARSHRTTSFDAEALYKDRFGGIITNFNRSSDLCTVGPEIKDKHGFLFSSSSVIATKRLVPIFGECKVNVNSDILFPANMYWKHDKRYDYSAKHDVHWDDKKEVMIWRGVTSGGTQNKDNWQQMHRQRLVMLTNGTEMQGKDVRILAEQPEKRGEYENFRQFRPSEFAEKHTDVGFTETWGCIPDCSFYDNVFSLKSEVSLPEQFKYKYLVDVDGHSFSGRWHAFLQSKSLRIKATIFREWHDSRLFAWRHFVPMDNRYDDMYSLLTYFVGLGMSIQQQAADNGSSDSHPYVARHDSEGKRIADQGREWASKVLRREDIEIYMFRLLLEYARIIDDNRDQIGYSGDGSELDKYDGVPLAHKRPG